MPKAMPSREVPQLQCCFSSLEYGFHAENVDERVARTWELIPLAHPGVPPVQRTDAKSLLTRWMFPVAFAPGLTQEFFAAGRPILTCQGGGLENRSCAPVRSRSHRICASGSSIRCSFAGCYDRRVDWNRQR